VKRPRLIPPHAALAVAGLLAGCSVAVESTTSATTAATALVTTGITVEQAMADNAAAQAGAIDYDPSSATTITLTGASAVASADTVVVSGDTVTITAPGTYVLSGSLQGQVVVDSGAEGVVRLVLAGASISSSGTAAIAVTDADEAVIVLADGTTNALTGPAAFADTVSEDAPNAALFSMTDLTLGGGGALTVEAPAGDGIASKDGLVITGGTVTVDAADDGIRGKDHLVVSAGTLRVTAGGDALKADNETEADQGYIALQGGTVTAVAGGDGLAAATDVLISGGEVSATTGGGAGATLAADASAKAVKAGVNLVVGGGTLQLDAADDALHSNAVISLTGGSFDLASGDDAVHAETALTISDGALTVSRSVEGLESEVIEISGGTIEVTSSDDALNVSAAGTSGAAQGPGGGAGGAAIDGHVTVSGGTLTLHASGDGFDSNGDATITGGTVIVDGPTSSGNGALDVHVERGHPHRGRVGRHGGGPGRLEPPGMDLGRRDRTGGRPDPGPVGRRGTGRVHGVQGVRIGRLLRAGDRVGAVLHRGGGRCHDGGHRR